jgi:hypothetical protein
MGICAAILLLALCSMQAMAQGANLGDIQKRLSEMFTLARTTADHTDLVAAGSVLVLHKDGLLMYSTPTAYPALSVYKNGLVQQSSGSNFMRGLGSMMLRPSGEDSSAPIPQRKFVAGEKFFISAINVQPDGVTFTFYSDVYNDLRYYGQLKFPFPKKAVPPLDDVVRAVGEVISVDDGGAAAQAPASAPAVAVATNTQEAIAAIPPPDQPPAPPKTIAVGQSEDQVVAIWGQPQKVANLPAKKVLYYPDMKVTLVRGKVADVQ